MAQIPLRGTSIHSMFDGLGLTFAATPAQEAIIFGNLNGESIKVDGEDCFALIINSDQQYKVGPCPYSPRNGVLPAAGDRALVITSDENDPWIVAWWPYG